jgi:hypothetical protein
MRHASDRGAEAWADDEPGALAPAGVGWATAVAAAEEQRREVAPLGPRRHVHGRPPSPSSQRTRQAHERVHKEEEERRLRDEMRRIIAAQAQQRRKAGATAAAATAGPRVGRGATQASGADAPLCQKPQLEPEPEVPPPVSGSGVGVASGGKDLSLRSSDDPDFGVSYWRRSRRIMRATATPHGPHHTCSSSSSSGGVGGDGDTSRATWLQAAHEGPVSSRSVGGGEAAWTAQPEPMLLVETSSESSCGRERGSINTHHTDSRRRTGSSRVMMKMSPARRVRPGCQWPMCNHRCRRRCHSSTKRTGSRWRSCHARTGLQSHRSQSSSSSSSSSSSCCNRQRSDHSNLSMCTGGTRRLLQAYLLHGGTPPLSG